MVSLKLSAFFILTIGGAIRVVADVPASSISSSQWQTLNDTLGGKLRTALPFSAPCFSTVNGLNVSVDSEACSSVEANYTKPLYRVEQFGAYMLVSVRQVS